LALGMALSRRGRWQRIAALRLVLESDNTLVRRGRIVRPWTELGRDHLPANREYHDHQHPQGSGHRICPGGPALRRDRRCCALPGGKRGSKLAAGADAELGEDFPQVVGDGGGANEQLRGDLRVGGTVAGQAGDQRFLRGKPGHSYYCMPVPRRCAAQLRSRVGRSGQQYRTSSAIRRLSGREPGLAGRGPRLEASADSGEGVAILA